MRNGVPPLARAAVTREACHAFPTRSLARAVLHAHVLLAAHGAVRVAPRRTAASSMPPPAACATSSSTSVRAARRRSRVRWQPRATTRSSREVAQRRLRARPRPLGRPADVYVGQTRCARATTQTARPCARTAASSARSPCTAATSTTPAALQQAPWSLARSAVVISKNMKDPKYLVALWPSPTTPCARANVHAWRADTRAPTPVLNAQACGLSHMVRAAEAQ